MAASDYKYCESLNKYTRRVSQEVNIGGIPLGGNQPIRIQSMTTPDTMDIEASVEQILEMVASGCEYARLTAPSKKEAENLKNIKEELLKRGCQVPLVADIHFTPNAAEVAARIVEKVRINPGNFVDKKRFESLEYTDEEYEEELQKIREKFIPLLDICKANGTVLRIGTNHGSLSDRIVSKYGDSPAGMVESAMEFLRICEEQNFYEVVISMKSSNTQVMVQAYRLLVHRLDTEGLKAYPLHLGVTEAGEGEDGRIKSAIGIGTLLEDGLGDTIRVSLTEDPVLESPVAKKIVSRYENRAGHVPISGLSDSPINPFSYKKRRTTEVLNFGKDNVPRVITDISKLTKENDLEYKDLKSIGHFYLPALDKWKMNDRGTDYVYSGSNPIPFMLPNGLREITDYETWSKLADKQNRFPLLSIADLNVLNALDSEVSFLKIKLSDLNEAVCEKLRTKSSTVLIVETENKHAMAEQRALFFKLIQKEILNPVIISRNYAIENDLEQFQLDAAIDVGGLLIDGLGDGIFLQSRDETESREFAFEKIKTLNDTAFTILQASRTRMSKTEYISCPSCGRTLFDLQETTAMIRKRTDHLKEIKIGIMGCIVNGPGEMADADYGYVGSGKGKITLYKGQDVMKRSVPSENAVDELIEIIKADGKWRNPEKMFAE